MGSRIIHLYGHRGFYAYLVGLGDMGEVYSDAAVRMMRHMGIGLYLVMVWSLPSVYIIGRWVICVFMGSGTGLERINEICKKDNAPVPDIEFNENYFYVNFRQSEEYLKLAKGDTTQETTQKTTQKILSAMRENPNTTRDELARIVGITPDGVKYHLDNLKKKGIIKRVGPDKGGHWEVI